MNIIGYIYTDFQEKFGVPRQSRLVDTPGKIVLNTPYNSPDCVRGLEEFSHIWVLWQFSENLNEEGESKWSATVRPPRLGGNQRKGVFATRSPFRPNPIGMSCVRLERIEIEETGPVIYVTGSDMVNKTPVFDIKPYIPYADSVPDAEGSFSNKMYSYGLEVKLEDRFCSGWKEEDVNLLKSVLSQDPRPSYQDDPERVYGMDYGGYNVKFRVEEGTLYVVSIDKKD